MLKSVPIEELVPGMFVNQVLEQSGRLKMRSKGLVKTQMAIDALKKKGIVLLEIDLSKSQHQTESENEGASVKVEGSDDQPAKSLRQRNSAKVKPSRSQSDGLTAANDLYLNAVMIQSEFVSQLEKGTGASIEKVTNVSQGIIDEIFENTNAITCLTLIKNADEYLLEHSINCAILMSLFAKHMGFDKALIENLSLAAMLMDVGMASISSTILQKPNELTAREREIVKGHVSAGLKMLEHFDHLSDVVLDIVGNHHERVDGSGYPAGKKGDEISVYARMAAIVDSYDAMVSDRAHQQGQTSTPVLSKLMVDPTLDTSLVHQFIKCIGVHPVGSLVKLKSEKLALVSNPGKKNPLKPVVMTFYSLRTQSHAEIKRIDLAKSDDEIVTSVRPSEFKMNLSKFFKEVFIHQVP